MELRRQTRTYCYIVDAMIGFLKVIASGLAGEVYNIGNPKPEVSVIQLIKIIENSINKKLNFKIVKYPNSYPEDEPLRRCPNISKATRDIEFNPLVELDNGLKRFFDWTQSNYEKNN